MAVCTTCHQPGITPGEHACPGPQYEDVVFTRHRGQGITVDTAPEHTRISLHALVDRYAYLHMPTPDRIVFADQVVYRITGYDAGALELELVEDWRPTSAPPDAPLGGVLPPDVGATADVPPAVPHGPSGQAVHPGTVLNQEKQP